MLTTFSIGNNVLIYEGIPDKKIFAFGITFPAGSSKESVKYPIGTAHFLEHMMFKGFKGTGPLKLTRKLEALGIEINAFTTKDLTHYYIRGLEKNFLKAANLFVKTIFQPALSNKDIEKEKLIIGEEILSYEDDFEELVFEEADKLLFEGTTYMHPITGTLSSIKNISRHNLIHFHDIHYLGGPTVFSYSGKEGYSKRLLNIIRQSAGNESSIDQSGLTSNYGLIVPDAKLSNRVKQIDGTTSHLLWSFPLGRIGFESRIRLSLLNYILGEGNSSKLFWRLREKLGLTYHVYSTINVYGHHAVLQIYLTLNPNKVRKATTELNKLIEQLATHITDKELTNAQTQIETQLVMESEDITNRMQANSKDWLIYGRIVDISEVSQIITNTNVDHIVNLAQQISLDNAIKVIYEGKSK